MFRTGVRKIKTVNDHTHAALNNMSKKIKNTEIEFTKIIRKNQTIK